MATAWPGHPRLCGVRQETAWMAGPSPAMTTVAVMLVPIDVITENTVANDTVFTSHSGMISITPIAPALHAGGRLF
jgi:hypothetical protein